MILPLREEYPKEEERNLLQQTRREKEKGRPSFCCRRYLRKSLQESFKDGAKQPSEKVEKSDRRKNSAGALL